jgi:rfaE bifunctional protein nucleotidyltransferase chain/domain
MADRGIRRHSSKIVDSSTLQKLRDKWRQEGKTVVFTNGCFDILHAGHLDYLEFARNQGDILIVGINSDKSIYRTKGEGRPVVPEQQRAEVLAGLECVDYVTVFEEDEPANLIGRILPDILVKGEDWSHYISGREAVEQNGGKVVLARLTPGLSTSRLIERIREIDRREQR